MFANILKWNKYILFTVHKFLDDNDDDRPKNKKRPKYIIILNGA